MAKVYAFIDSQNLNLGVRSEKWKLDYSKFRLYLKNKYGVFSHFVDNPKDSEIRNELLNKWKEDPSLQEQITTLVVTENNGVADVVNGQEIVSYPIRGE